MNNFIIVTLSVLLISCGVTARESITFNNYTSKINSIYAKNNVPIVHSKGLEKQFRRNFSDKNHQIQFEIENQRNIQIIKLEDETFGELEQLTENNLHEFRSLAPVNINKSSVYTFMINTEIYNAVAKFSEKCKVKVKNNVNERILFTYFTGSRVNLSDFCNTMVHAFSIMKIKLYVENNVLVLEDKLFRYKKSKLKASETIGQIKGGGAN